MHLATRSMDSFRISVRNSEVMSVRPRSLA